LEITVETGIIGLACYVWFIVVAVQQAWKNLNRLRDTRASEGLWIAAALSVMAGLMAQGLFDTVWYRPQVQILWWMAIALIASFCIQPQDEDRREEIEDRRVKAEE
jgi:putative inorganic carbon (hco3(-)) transporter